MTHAVEEKDSHIAELDYNDAVAILFSVAFCSSIFLHIIQEEDSEEQKSQTGQAIKQHKESAQTH